MISKKNKDDVVIVEEVTGEEKQHLPGKDDFIISYVHSENLLLKSKALPFQT